MSTQTYFILFVGVVCLTIAAPPANTRQKRQTIFFEDELDDSGNPNQGSDKGSDWGADASFRDTRAPHFGPAWHPPTYSHNHFGHWQSSHKGYGPDKFGWGYNPHDDFHGGSTSFAPQKPRQNSNSGEKPVDEALIREKRQLNRPANNQWANANVAGSWNQNQPSWNEIGNNGNANNGPDWDNIGIWGGNNGGAWNGNQRPNTAWNGNQNNGAWNQRPSTNQNNGQWNGNQNQGPNGNQNNGAWNGNQNNGAWNQNPNGNGNQNNGAWNQRPNGNQNGNGNQNNGGSWNNQRPNGNQNGGTGSWNGNNNGGTPNASGNNNGNFGNSIDSNNRPSRPGGSNSNRPRPGGSRPGGSRPGGNSQSIRPPIAIGGARPPSTPAPNCSCPSTSETNPVCGTDGSTYTNLSRLNCARVCGTSAGVQMQHYGACAATPSPDLRRRG